MSVPAQLKYIVLALLFLFAAYNFTKTTFSIIESSKRLEDLKSDVVSLETEKAQLEKELEFRQSDYYVEQEARNKLSMIKPGEEIYAFIDSVGNSATEDGEVKSYSDQRADIVAETSRTPIEQWLELFL